VQSYVEETTTSVTLRRGACFGTCPVYEVTLASDGTAIWDGERFVERLGRYKGEIDLNDYSRLVRFIERAGFFHFDDEYLGNVTDLPDYRLTVVSAGMTKSVLQNGVDEPPDFWVIATLIDALAESIDWSPVAAEAAQDMR
jgi:Domain of unknown function (DUF6438)